MDALRMNERATALADELASDAAGYGVVVRTLENGARVIDAGVHAAGGFRAGRRLAEICMGGLGTIDFTHLEIDDLRLGGLTVTTDHPAQACMASQYAGWKIDPEGFFAMGSGPLRAIARVEKELYAKLGYEETGAHGVLVLEGRQLPEEKVAEYVAKRSGVKPEGLTFVIAPTASIAGGVQISARVLETALHKMLELGFDVRSVRAGIGTAPLPPVAKHDLRAIGRTNDCILYGGRAHFTVAAEDDELSALAPKVPSSASSDYGTPFYEIFQRYEGDFYKIDPHLFSPAEIHLTGTKSGRTFSAGDRNADVLRASLFG
jgi:methenyltetrahydromethanopterin cyclohydrolase